MVWMNATCTKSFSKMSSQWKAEGKGMRILVKRRNNEDKSTYDKYQYEDRYQYVDMLHT